MDKILVITSMADTHANYMVEKITTRNIGIVRFNADELSNSLSVVYTTEKGHEVWNRTGSNKSLLFKTDDVQSVWYRKPLMSKFDRSTQKPETAFAGREIEAYISDMCVCLTEKRCKWINHPDANRIAGNKINQLRLAQKLGFRVPKTIVSNDPAEIQDFAEQLAPKKLIYKTLSHPFISETAKTFRSVYTTLIEMSPQVLQAIKPVPCLIQEYVDKAYELRITIVGDQLFAARIFSQEHIATQVDWRRDQHKIQLKQELVKIETAVEQACIKMVRQLNLVFGAIDMIVTPDGEYVFLEINPNGQWAWIEVTLGAQISEALINELTS